jgi:hypothetical protein
MNNPDEYSRCFALRAVELSLPPRSDGASSGLPAPTAAKWSIKEAIETRGCEKKTEIADFWIGGCPSRRLQPVDQDDFESVPPP